MKEVTAFVTLVNNIHTGDLLEVIAVAMLILFLIAQRSTHS